MENVRVTSTSRVSAICSDIVLRQTNTTRLVFRPELIENPSNLKAAVHGVFLFQKKGLKDAWQDTETIPLSHLKKDEGYKLDIKSAELLQLFNELQALYSYHEKSGIPRGKHELVRISDPLAQLAQLPSRELDQILGAQRAVGSDLLTKLLSWATKTDDPVTLVERLVGLGEESLQKLNAAIGLQTLRVALKVWEDNTSNSDEEFWQRSLTQHSFVLEHVFSWPSTIVKGKAYLGGKSVLNTDGKVVDFLVKNRITRNAALIEIKTPATALLGKRYRSDVHIPSEELSGAVLQVLNYKHSLQRDYSSLTTGQGNLFEVFDPRCAVILGNAKRELDHNDKIKSGSSRKSVGDFSGFTELNGA